MRGRRRGRNRPSDQGSQAVNPVPVPSSPGAVRVVEPVGSTPDGAVENPVVDDKIVDQESRALVVPDGNTEGGAGTGGASVSEGSAAPTGGPSVDDEPATSVAADQTNPDAPDETSTIGTPEDDPADDGTPDAESPDAGSSDPEAPAAAVAPDDATGAGDQGEAPMAVGNDEIEAVEGGDAPAPAEAGRAPQAASGNPLPRIIAVANQKGGVGKTTTSVNLGAALAELGFRVLVLDLDPQGNATTGMGIDARNFELSMYDVLMRDASLEDCIEPTAMKNLFVAPATIALAGAEIELVPAFSREMKLKRALETVIDDFDYVLIDCPPSLGLITVNALVAASEVLVPIQCEYYALEGLSQLMRNVHLVASSLNSTLDISTIVLTMYDARTKLADQVATDVRDHFGNKVCRIVIPRTVRLSEAPSFGQPITAFDPSSRGAIAYRELAKEVSGGTS